MDRDTHDRITEANVARAADELEAGRVSVRRAPGRGDSCACVVCTASRNACAPLTLRQRVAIVFGVRLRA